MARHNLSSTEGLSTIDVKTSARSRVAAPPEVPLLTILWHPDVRRIGERLVLVELLRGRDVRLTRREPDFTPPGGLSGRPLGDPHVSRRPISLRSGAAGAVELDLDGGRTRVAANGDIVDDRRSFSSLEVGSGVVLELAEKIVLLLHRGRPTMPAGGDLGLVGASAGVERLRAAIRDVADLEVPVLLRGATGTGKELAARALHDAGRRAGGPFAAVNLGALQPSLAAAELFGAKKGAYTGATQDQAGYFLHADGGTLFLDEVGEAPADIQVMLLRALETGEIVPVGERKPRRVDVRIVAATDADLDRLIGEGGFRAPLYHRLAGYEIRLPALGERRDDLGRLLAFFLRRESRALGTSAPDDKATPWPWLTASAVARLARFDWPGNVRQLQNVARQLVIAGRRGVEEAALEVERLLDELIRAPEWPEASSGIEPRSAVTTTTPARPAVIHRSPDDVGEAELSTALRAHRFRLKPTAEHLGVSRTSLYALIDRSENVRRAGDLEADELEAARERHGDDLEAMAEDLEISSHALLKRLRELGLV